MNILKLTDLSTATIEKIIERAQGFMEQTNFYPAEENKIIAQLFFEPSTRTHYSFDIAAKKLGFKTIEFIPETSSLKKGETLYDTVKNFESFGVDALVIRHEQENYFDEFIGKINIPIINAGDGTGNHPSQSLLDLMTIKQEFGCFKGLKVAIIGDVKHSRVAHTNIEIMKRLGMEVFLSGPEEFQECEQYLPLDEVLEIVDIVMLLRVQVERHQSDMFISKEDYHQAYGLTMDRVAQMKDHAIIMHPGPFNRGVEIADEVVECYQSRINKQVSNGVYIRMALLEMAVNHEAFTR